METQESGRGVSTDRHTRKPIVILAVIACIVILHSLSACSECPSLELTEEELTNQQEAVIGRIAEYTDAIRDLDVDRMLTFYPRSSEWVYAGDGDLVVGFDANSKLMRQFLSSAAKMEEIEFWNPNVLSLAPDAAAYTTEYRWSMITTVGDTVRMRGSWTYVMRRVGDDWMIFHSTGTHVPMESSDGQ